MIYVICGKKRVGKDTAAGILRSRDIRPVALADKLKNVLESASLSSNDDFIRTNFIDKEMFWKGDREKPLPISNASVEELFEQAFCACEHMIFNYGNLSYNRNVFDILLSEHVKKNTEAWSMRRLMQVFGTDIMCGIDESIWVMFALQKIIRLSCDVVITDCRQKHEQQMLSQLGGKFIFINKDTGLVDNHSTEQGLIPQPDDVIVDNNGTFENLKNQLIEIMK